MNAPSSETTVFGRASRQGADSLSAVDLPGQSAIGRVGSFLFDSLRLQAGSGEKPDGWRIEVLSVQLLRPSRRRIRLTLRGNLLAVRQGRARISLSCESRRVCAELVNREAQALPDGALPSSDRELALSLVVPRSVRKRTDLRVQIFLEAAAESQDAQVEAAVDSIDMAAL